MILEYVASGLGHSGILKQSVLNDSDCISIIKTKLEYLNDKNNHKFSVLFNAFTEAKFGNLLKNNYRDSVHTIHADSGGLQMITRGMEITNDLKDQVYKNQSKNSDIGMCFDEIPIKVAGGRSDRNDTSNRFFDQDNLEYYARETGKNIKRQIEVFLQEQTCAKPMLIAQGNCYDSYMKWVEYILKEIPRELQSNIGGISMGAAALGTGYLEDIERAAYATNLPFEMQEPYIHILGVGSIRRLIPYLNFMRNGYYPDNLHISYDSTTHTSGLTLGSYFIDGKLSKISRTFDDQYIKIYNDIKSKFTLKDINHELFLELLNSNSKYYTREDKTIDSKKQLQVFEVLISFIVGSIDNFTHLVNKTLKSKNKMLSVAYDNKVLKETLTLCDVTNINEFKEWYKSHSLYVNSNRIKPVNNNNLDNFLE